MGQGSNKRVVVAFESVPLTPVLSSLIPGVSRRGSLPTIRRLKAVDGDLGGRKDTADKIIAALEGRLRVHERGAAGVAEEPGRRRTRLVPESRRP